MDFRHGRSLAVHSRLACSAALTWLADFLNHDTRDTDNNANDSTILDVKSGQLRRNPVEEVGNECPEDWESNHPVLGILAFAPEHVTLALVSWTWEFAVFTKVLEQLLLLLPNT